MILESAVVNILHGQKQIVTETWLHNASTAMNFAGGSFGRVSRAALNAAIAKSNELIRKRQCILQFEKSALILRSYAVLMTCVRSPREKTAVYEVKFCSLQVT